MIEVPKRWRIRLLVLQRATQHASCCVFCRGLIVEYDVQDQEDVLKNIWCDKLSPWKQIRLLWSVISWANRARLKVKLINIWGFESLEIKVIKGSSAADVSLFSFAKFERFTAAKATDFMLLHCNHNQLTVHIIKHCNRLQVWGINTHWMDY